jgi:hypothetical protein
LGGALALLLGQQADPFERLADGGKGVLGVRRGTGFHAPDSIAFSAPVNQDMNPSCSYLNGWTTGDGARPRRCGDSAQYANLKRQ